MLYKYNKKLKKTSQKLRREMTDAERFLWSKIRRRQIAGYQFCRQKPIENYILDFYCCRAKLNLEIDGGQHYEEAHMKEDFARDQKLRKMGIKVLRFTNLDVLKNIDNVIIRICGELNS